jgi:hypothetical protein
MGGQLILARWEQQWVGQKQLIEQTLSLMTLLLYETQGKYQQAP